MTNFLLGIGYTLLTIILGKIVFYYIVTFIEYVYYLFNKKERTEEAIKDILTYMTDTKSFLLDAGKLMQGHEELNEDIVRQIIQLPAVQRQIIWTIEERKFVKKADIEEGLKTFILRAWRNRSD